MKLNKKNKLAKNKNNQIKFLNSGQEEQGLEPLRDGVWHRLPVQLLMMKITMLGWMNVS